MDWAKITVTTSYDASEAVANCLFEMNATGVEFKEIDTAKIDLIAYYPLDDRVGARMQSSETFSQNFQRGGFSQTLPRST